MAISQFCELAISVLQSEQSVQQLQDKHTMKDQTVSSPGSRPPLTGPPEKRRKDPGRPLGSTKAAKNTKDIWDVFKGLYE